MKERPEHVITQTKGNHRPGSVIFVDTETNQETAANGEITHTLKLGFALFARNRRGVILSKQDHIPFRDLDTFWDWVDKKCASRSTTYLTAHNLIFDLSVLDGFKALYDRGWKLDSLYTKALVSMLRWSNQGRRIYAVDNTNLFPGKLARWGDLLGLPKLTVDFQTVTDADLSVYCERDVEILYRCWVNWFGFLTSNACGNWKPTTSSTAFNTWRHRFMPAKVHIHNQPLALDLERKSYHGGRCEILYQGTLTRGPFYYLDVNNMYGYVLSRYYYPAGIYNSVETDSMSMLIEKLGKYAVIADVDVSIDTPWFPMKKGSHTCYPVGQFRTTLTTPELMLAFNNGYMRGVHSLAWYRQAPLFSDYVHTFTALRYQYKKAGNLGYSEICKLLINGLYGKFGQAGMDQKRIGDTEIDRVWSSQAYDIEHNEYYRMFAIGGGVYEERKTGESYNSFPGIAAHVTAYARLHLYHLIQSVPAGHVFYMDTDSMITDQVGLDVFKDKLDPLTLGALKIEESADQITIHAPKDYVMGERVKVKGITQDAVRIIDNEYQQLQWARLAGMIRRGAPVQMIVKPVIKRLAREVLSGVLEPTGWVSPFVLGEGEEEQAEFLPLRPFQPVLLSSSGSRPPQV